MIVVSSGYLKSKEKILVKKYASYVMNKFVRRGILRKASIGIHVIDNSECSQYTTEENLDFRSCSAWSTYDKVVDGRKYFTVVVNRKLMTKAKKPVIKLRDVLVTVGHELVHVKQYLNGEIFDYKSGDVRYKGSYFDSSYQKSEESYNDSPWEIEAYGRETGLYKMFLTKLKEEGSKK